MKKISAIIPVYNVEDYIDKCIESLLLQSLDNFEILLIDDGSTDNSGMICDSYANKYENIKVFHKENGGLSSARNYGLEKAKGEFISFIDSDDWIHKDMYLELYNAAIKNKADIAQCRYLKVFNEDIEINTNINRKIEVFNNIAALNNFYNDKYKETVVCWNKIYRKKLFNDIKFPVGKIHEDEFTTHKLIYKAKKIVYLKDELYYYRQREGSIMRSGFNIKELSLLEAFKEQSIFMKNINNEELYYRSLNRYLIGLRLKYYQCQNSLKNNRKILEQIKKEYQLIYFKNIKNNKIKFMTKINESIFMINPTIYKKINNVS